MNNKHQNTNKTIKTTLTPRTDKLHIEIEKYFVINKKKSSQINQGIETFPVVGEIDEFIEPNKNNVESRFLKSSSSLLQSSNRDFDIASTSDCTSLNRKVEEINKQLADLEKDIQTNFYDPKTPIGSFVQQNPNNTPISQSQFSFITNINKTAQKYKPPSIQVEIGIKKSKSKTEVETLKPKSSPKSELKNDASAELKSEIMQYRQSIKNKVLEEKMERKLEELRRNEKIEQESGSFQLPLNLPESIRKIREFQKSSER